MVMRHMIFELCPEHDMELRRMEVDSPRKGCWKARHVIQRREERRDLGS